MREESKDDDMYSFVLFSIIWLYGVPVWHNNNVNYNRKATRNGKWSHILLIILNWRE